MPTTRPGEYLVVARKGNLVNCGEAVHLTLMPGTVWVKVPGIQLETTFEMTQETKDGIPMRFKGSAVYRIVRPEVTAALFDFSQEGTEDIGRLMNQCCLGELRDQVSRLTMAQCVEERKTTLTEAVSAALEHLVSRPGADWGISIEVVLVSQVFIVDPGLRQQLEAEARSAVRVTSERAQLLASEAVELATIASKRRIQDEALETERRRALLEEETLVLTESIERKRAREALQTAEDRARIDAARLEAEAPVARQRHQLKLLELREEQQAVELELAVNRMRVERDFASRRAEQALLLERLPIEQRPQIAEAASCILQGAKLSVYGEDSRLVGALEPLLGFLGEALREAPHS